MINIIIADDQPMFCEMLAHSLGINGDFNVLGTASHGLEAVELCESFQPDIIIMDIKMDICDGVEATKIIKKRFPDIKVLILTNFDDGENVSQAIKAGIDGYIVKNSNINELYRAITDTCQGLKVFDRNSFRAISEKYAQVEPPSDKSEDILSEEHDVPFNKTELEILRLIAVGTTTAGIAKNLYLSTGTVYNYISRMMIRLGFSDRVQLIAYALRNRIIR
ncbi:response regulator transcription factor [Candidatus Contubernalis alkaliaceticus]|uniref:response regulator transcription factor n=1 Tax=Candidatus Contubernalis alkaliaceticus TaxID=338645 RepID=UPI001F4C4DC9|nr:response regulator transcription factor [Candidatus Contubernalis alkalaceticus]UNC91452.1 response regulator transcription factor [Candidatus Contubernalis alkalaceticus]